MREGTLPEVYKQLSVLRRVGELGRAQWSATPGAEGNVGVFRFAEETTPVVIEAVSGRSMALVPGDIFLATPGHRESVHWTVGGVPDGGLRPGEDYWILAESGVIGSLIEASPVTKDYLAQAKYLGTVIGACGEPLNVRDFALRAEPDAPDAGAPVHLLLGTSVEVGKTTAGLTLLQTLLDRGHQKVLVLKATGTSSVTEAAAYRDFGAAEVFDCIDFGIPTTFPCGRRDASAIFGQALDVCLSLPMDVVLIECGGDFLGTGVPEFVRCLLPRRPNPTTILAAFDVAGAFGAKHLLERMGVSLHLVTGPCTDTSISRQRVETVCGIPARSMRS
jgi:hypothetical protein